ncbi:hypothetical protein KIL84_013199 [Mauremys mutica]|uniref:Uncharacterized protein n=1 Tax=Mauremys mutica TaxID=74926 RepID=A0A9D3WQQ7_9SAUR|nr:hypothetical protein KIL84_013199 [Mauremys mutica]
MAELIPKRAGMNHSRKNPYGVIYKSSNANSTHLNKKARILGLLPFPSTTIHFWHASMHSNTPIGHWPNSIPTCLTCSEPIKPGRLSFKKGAGGVKGLRPGALQLSVCNQHGG